MNPTGSLLSRDEISHQQWRRIQSLLDEVLPANPFWQQKFTGAGCNLRDLRSFDDFLGLPFTTKADFVADQSAHPPYGTNFTYDAARYCRLHQTSGTTTGQPLRWLDTADSWSWMLGCWNQIYQLMALHPSDKFCFTFAFGPFLGFWAGFEGALRQGNFCIAAGGMSSEARLKLIADNGITILACTPTYALRLAETAVSEGVTLAADEVRGVLVAGEPGGNIPAVRERITQAWAARVFDHWGMTEIGPLASEADDDPGHLTVLESECFAEIIDPNSAQPVAPGELGELVITNFGRTGSPVIRYRTGDLVRAETSTHASGRNWLRLKGGIQDRVDDMLIVRGNNVFPTSIEAIVREFTEIVEFRIVATRQREMEHLRIEVEILPDITDPDRQDVIARLSRRIKDRLNFQAEIITVDPGSLPRFELKARRIIRE